jgi:restriction endonuclease S subunit
MDAAAIADHPPKSSKRPFSCLRYGASIGKMAISEINAATNQAIACCSPSKVVDIDYLFWRSKDQSEASPRWGKEVRSQISASAFSGLQDPFAPLAEQRRIVSRVNALFADIAEARRQAKSPP